LAHWALTKERTETRNLPQFTVLHLPALGIVKAIGRQVCAKGLSKFYWQAARAASAKLRNKTICLPSIDEI